jgi:hypothetical protein
MQKNSCFYPQNLDYYKFSKWKVIHDPIQYIGRFEFVNKNHHKFMLVTSWNNLK